MRCFLAIELPEPTLHSLGEAGCVLRELEPGWVGEKWVASDVMHVTLKFLGEVDETTLDRLASGFAEVAAAQRPFILQISSLRAMPRLSGANMIWAVADDPGGGCTALARAADQVAVLNGLKTESRPFVPHVNLVRARRPRSVSHDALGQAFRRSGLAASDSMSVLSATLFSSTLTPNGPIHERLAEFTFHAEQGPTEPKS